MRRDERVFLLGEDVAAAEGVFKTTGGLLKEFGPRRVKDTPISELAILGAAMGAAMTGLRPVAEIMAEMGAGIGAIMTDADPWLFFTRPISGGLLLASVASVAFALWQHRRQKARQAAGYGDADF